MSQISLIKRLVAVLRSFLLNEERITTAVIEIIQILITISV